MKLSIIVPVYNEEKTVKTVIDTLVLLNLPCQKELIVVDDGSTDGTRKQITDNLKHKIKAIKMLEESDRCIIKVIAHNKNQGKGAAVQSGIKQATGDYILIHDADLEYDPKDIPKLLSPVLTHKDKIAVYGSRFLSIKNSIPILYLLGNKFLTILTNLIHGTRLTDMETGYKLLPAEFARKVEFQRKRFDIEPEITINLAQNNIPIIEIPISYKSRTHLAGKKLTIKDALSAIKTIFFYKF